MIITLAGRRIDASDATEERFPLKNADRVAQETQARFESLNVSALVCAAACGADLIALNAARNLGIRMRIVLPFAPEQFRKTSVTDRAGNSKWNWGALFDEFITEANDNDDLIVLSSADDEADDDDTVAYLATNQRLIAEALSLSRAINDNDQDEADTENIRAMILWEGESRGAGDVTADFVNRARQAGIALEEVKTN
jgi:hypothetical protein